MPLSAAQLEQAIAAEIRARVPALQRQDDGVDALAGAIAVAVVAHLTAAAVVLVPGQPPGRVT